MSGQAGAYLGLILAGGQGRRLGGRNKALLPIDGVPLVEHAAARLRVHCTRIIISANRDHEQLAAYADEVRADDATVGGGPLAGIRTVLNRYPDQRWLILAVDMPRLPPRAIDALAAHPDHYLCHGADRLICINLAPSTARKLSTLTAGHAGSLFAALTAVKLQPLVVPLTAEEAVNVNTPEQIEAVSK